jgi:hypothetical protein
MRSCASLSVVLLCILSLSSLSCGGGGKPDGSDENPFAEADLGSPSPDVFEKGTAVLRGTSTEVFIQKLNSKVHTELDIASRGAFYMKVCGMPTEQGEPGAVKFDVIVGENTEKPFTIYGSFVLPAASLADVQRFVNITVDISRYAGQTVDLTMRLVGDEGAALAWTQPEWKPFAGQGAAK